MRVEKWWRSMNDRPAIHPDVEQYLKSSYLRMETMAGAPIFDALMQFVNLSRIFSSMLQHGCDCPASPLLAGVQWIRTPTLVFPMEDCAIRFMLGLKAELGSLGICDVCSAAPGIPEMVAFRRIIYVMTVCADCAGHPHAKAPMN